MTIGEIETQVLAVLQQSGANAALESLLHVAFNQAKLDACLKHDFVKSQRTVYVAVRPGERFRIADLPYCLGTKSTEYAGGFSVPGTIKIDTDVLTLTLNLESIQPAELLETFNPTIGSLTCNSPGDYTVDLSTALTRTLADGVLTLTFDLDATDVALTSCVWTNFDALQTPVVTNRILQEQPLYKSLKFASIRGTEEDALWRPIQFMNNINYFSKQLAASRGNVVYNGSCKDVVLLHEGDEFWLYSADPESETEYYDLRLNIQEFVAPYVAGQDSTSDFFTEYCHHYLFWYGVVVGNALVGVFLPRQEGALDVPSKQLEDAWTAIMDWDNALVQCPWNDTV